MKEKETAAKRAKFYLEILHDHEVKGLTFQDMAIKRGKTYQNWQQQYNKACEWREKYGRNNDR